MKYIFTILFSYFIIIEPSFTHTFNSKNIFIDHPHIKIKDGFAKGWLNINNKSKSQLDLIGVRTNFSNDFEFHKDELINNNLEMLSIEKISIPAETEVSFKKSNLHIMFRNLNSKLNWFESHNAILIFNNSIEVEIEFDVD